MTSSMHPTTRHNVLAFLETNHTSSERTDLFQSHANMVTSVFKQKQKELHAAERSLADLKLKYERLKNHVLRLHEEVDNAELARKHYHLEADESDWLRRQDELSTFAP